MLIRIECAIVKAFEPVIGEWDCPQGKALEDAARGVLEAMKSPTQGMRIAAVEAVANHRRPEVEELRARPRPAWAVMACNASKETDVAWAAMIESVLAPV